ncbi:hypothetical protein JMF89_04935 [Clostridiaceae bacterium UIB06]|uniref:Uncharacterized protein n=1 Tax=Clostridium thailandense TaxID=2794346 RepID=A0A949TYN7_9CLOT|nr:hypothetical protein [Clostridium thailandense]MBV7275048.1 hypothetical protein [Clostridium thailandense]MCH5136562.1 hypothetical protein [Clostridiaceae bacterium UIB06]
MRKTVLLQVCDDGLRYKEVLGKGFIVRVTNMNKYEKSDIKINDIRQLKVNFKKKNLFIILDGEELYIKIMILPKLKKEKIYEIIRSELEYRFKNIDNIMFTYQIIKDNGSNLEAIVLCLNWSRMDLVEDCVKRGAKLKGIYPIQFCILDNYKRIIKEKKYIFTFLYKGILYFLACSDNKIIANSVVKPFIEKNFMNELDKFRTKCNVLEVFKDLPKIVLLNLSSEGLIKNIKKLYKCYDLGNICEDEIQFV